jgi:PAS domain S-box-containing protein
MRLRCVVCCRNVRFATAVSRRRHVISKPDRAAGGFDEKRLWERTFDSVPDLIAILDCDHRVVQVNRALANRLGRAPQQCVGLRCYEAIHGLTQPPPFCPHALTLNDGLAHAAEVCEERLGGCFYVTTTPLRDECGQTIGSVHVARDITDQKKAHDGLKHLLEASDHERHLVGYEIHDGLAQQLAAALMQFEVFDCVREKDPQQAAQAHALGLRLIREAHVEARRLIGRLRPPHLEEGGILLAIENLVRESNRRQQAQVEFCSNLEQLELEPVLESTVFRIVQECIANACRHSKSKRVKVALTHRRNQLRVEVQDWGIGFDVDRVREGHFGLESIQERAKVFGGTVRIRSKRRKGTAVVVELPLQSSQRTNQNRPSSRPTQRPASGRRSSLRRPK